MYVCQINGKSVFEIIKKKSMLSADAINSKIDKLIKNQLVNEDRNTLTEIGRNSLHVVLAGGVFDIIHPGHIYTLNAAKALGDVLVVVVATDNTSEKMKKRRPLHTQEQRQELVNSLSMVDLCLVGQEDDIFKTVDRVRPQIIALGYDQIHQEAIKQFEILEGIKINSFSDGKRTYGWVKCFPAKLNNSINCELIILERTHHDDSIIELISKVCIRKTAKLKDGSKVLIKIPINS